MYTLIYQTLIVLVINKGVNTVTSSLKRNKIIKSYSPSESAADDQNVVHVLDHDERTSGTLLAMAAATKKNQSNNFLVSRGSSSNG